MTTNNDALRETLTQKAMSMAVANGWIPHSLPHDEYLSTWALMAEFVEALAASKPEPQAQAGEPLTKDDILRMARTGGGEVSCVAEPLEHPWKFSESELIRFASLLILAERERTTEAIAKKDAALKACVEASWKLMARLDPHDYPDEQAELSDTITQAQEALK